MPHARSDNPDPRYIAYREQGKPASPPPERSLDPLPASLTNGRFDALAANQAHEDLFWDWHSMPCVHRNTVWCCITEPTARAKFPEYDQEMRYLVARMRSAYARHVGEPEWEEDIRRLSALSREFADLWARHEVADPEPRTRTFIHPHAGPLTFTITELQIPTMADARLMVNTPADTRTRDRLPLTRRREGVADPALVT